MTRHRRKIIIDTDPGQDDAFALLLALASPDELDVLGICSVAGNVPLNWTTRNARIICELAGKPQAKVFEGCAAPLKRKLVTAEHVHGKTGLDGPVMVEPTMALQEQHAVDFLIETLRREGRLIQITAAGLQESHPHDVLHVADAPNYTQAK